MTLIAMKKIVVAENIRHIEGLDGVDDFLNTPLEEFPVDARDSILSLAESIKSDGLINPITVKDLGRGERFRLIAGHRRFKAAQHLGMTQIDAKSIKGKAEREPVVALIENIHRDDLNPMDVAKALEKIRVSCNISKQAALADIVKRSPSWVSQHLSLLKADESVAKAVESGEIGLNAARTIAAMPKEEQAGALKDAAKESSDAGKPKVTAKSARRQSTRSKKKKKDRQQTIRPLEEREHEQRDDLLREFMDMTWGEEKPPAEAHSIAKMFWSFLMDRGRLVIKP